ncbi:MAG: hypothetical protein JNK72_11750 [Myxococcales bacterium]|nr:hypothetical protein [Myxococcales bacterium]
MNAHDAGPYRAAQAQETQRAAGSYRFAWEDGTQRTSAFAWLQGTLMVVGLAAMVGFENPRRFWFVIGLGALVLGYQWRRHRPGALSVSVADGVLTVHPDPRIEKQPRHYRLDAIDNVLIGRKEVQHLAVTQTSFVPDTQLSETLSMGRIELVLSSGRVEFVDARFVHDMVCTEVTAKVRRLMRAGGWRPRDERDAPADAGVSDAPAPRQG